VEFIFNEAVERVDVTASHAHGVVLGHGQDLTADAVLANADLPYIYNELLPDADFADKMSHKRFSCSVISFF